jgi:hypothetical protein
MKFAFLDFFSEIHVFRLLRPQKIRSGAQAPKKLSAALGVQRQ